jgi:hypothetical protein
MSRMLCLPSVLLLLATASAIRPAAAAWPHDPSNGNVPVCTAVGNQYGQAIASDGAGGAIVAWQDYRGGAADIVVQRVSAAGVPLWTANGVVICAAASDQTSPQIVADGVGGAVVVWTDLRGASFDIYAQRVNAAGVVQWTANGVVVCGATSGQTYPSVIPDGAGGTIVAWQDFRAGATADIYAQWINAAGVAQWTANGVALCAAADNQYLPAIAADGAGGAIVAWQDYRGGAAYDVYAQRINSLGAVQWTANGTVVCTNGGDQTNVSVISDGTGGAICTWYDTRAGNDDIYAQRLNATGYPLWVSNGLAVCSAADDQLYPKLVSDAAAGAIITWYDYRSGTNFDIYAQRVTAEGAVQWSANGAAVCTYAGDQANPTIVSDAAGGAIIVWADARSGTGSDIYAQRVSGTGAVQWTANGAAVSTAVVTQYLPVVAPDGAGGAIAAWYDSRSVSSYDIYAQRIEHYGQLGNPEPAITRARDVPNDQGGSVKLSWDASWLDADPVFGVYEYRVFRSAAGPLAAGTAARRAVTEDSDIAVREGALLAASSAGATVYWEYVGTQAAEGLPGYSRVVATTADSVAGSNPRTWFMVEARATSSLSSDRWCSAPDSGYSVDNLPPAAPAPFTGQYAAGTAKLHWNPNTEGDLAGYRLYRGSHVYFPHDPAHLVAALPDTGYADAAGAPYVYELTAVDSHGNESPVATLIPSGTLGVGDGAPLSLSLAAPSPNPARGATTLRYTLSRAGHVRLAVFDAAGRRVAILRDGELPAGGHAESFTLRDESGRDLPSGLYLVRLEAEGRVLTRRLAAIR